MTPRVISYSTGLLDDGLVTIPEASLFLGISKSKLYVMMDGGELPYVKFGKARRVPKRALVELAQANLKGGWRWLA